MQEQPNNLETGSYIEFKIGKDTTKENVHEKFRNERPIRFLYTANQDLYLSDNDHAALKSKSGIDAKDVVSYGYIRKKGDFLEKVFENDEPMDLRRVLQKKFDEFRNSAKS